MDIQPRRRTRLFNFRFIYIGLSSLLFFSQFIYFYLNSSFGMPSLMRNQSGILTQYLRSPKLVSEFAWFAFCQFLFGFLFFYFIYWVIQKNKELFNLNKVGEFLLGLGVLFSAVAAVFFANNYYFQFSRFAFWLYGSEHVMLSFFIYAFFSLISVVFIVLALIGAGKKAVRYQGFRKKWWLGAAAALAVFIGLPFTLSIAGKRHEVASLQSHSDQPNIIVIGIDSLRPDYVASVGGQDRKFLNGQATITPNIDRILKGATIFSDSYTPIARTFPAWISILTGQYPDQNSIYFNLISSRHLDKTSLLTVELKKLGYYTIFGMDDRRFSNIDERYGFDAVIGPGEGMNDFLLGALNDFPLTNLIINSRLGRWIFPYSYANRSGAVTYDPASFDSLIDKKIASLNAQPVFLAVHFCLPHWPYYWAVEQPQQGPYLKNASLQYIYEEGILRADHQVASFWQLLEARGLLKNAIVVVLSDHGESLLEFDSRLFEDDKYNPGKNRVANLTPIKFKKKLYGHGAYLSTLYENHNVLAFRFFGQQVNRAGRINSLVSLIDIKPTVLNLLNQPSNKSSGVSLAQVILQGSDTLGTDRSVMMQTGLNVVDLKSQNVKLDTVVNRGMNFYQVDPKTGLLSLQESYLPYLIKNKARSILYKNWYLLALPRSYFKKDPVPEPRAALIDLKTGQWTDNLASDFAHRAPVALMLKRMKNLFGSNMSLDFPECRAGGC